MMRGATQQPPFCRAKLVHEASAPCEEWELLDEQVPESRPHDLRVVRVRALLTIWTSRLGVPAIICRNLAVRWDEDSPKVGVDPDLCVLAPPPPEGDQLMSLRLWEPGHLPPVLAIEIVSASRADKDYGQSPAKYAANGTREL